ncbi:MAG: hypothetical protein KC423_25065 [Anaerolineales bacterium]|nr:hypothetical protein [Anaerolineales bacterium]MCB0000516.1 hypothetical protein [Anaerolineales bacterium]
MSNINPSPETAYYQIRLKGHLDGQWGCWFDGLTVELAENGQTVLSGPVADQAALYGLLRKARDLGLPLLSVCCLDDGTRTNADERG